jgi:cytoskeletal protein CcmA (bactofilin family)
MRSVAHLFRFSQPNPTVTTMRYSIFILLCLVLLPHTLLASTIVRSGETVAVAADQVVEGDFYGVGGTIAVSGEVTEDIFLAGGTVTMNGATAADLLVLGGTVDVHGTIADDIRIVGGTVIIAGTVSGNVAVIASELKILSTATIGGDVLFFGGRAEISGEVSGDVLGTSEALRIDTAIAGDVDVTTRTLTLGERAVVEGNVSYLSALDLVRAQAAQVKGSIVRNSEEPVPDDTLRSTVMLFLVIVFAALVVQLLLTSFTTGVVTHTNERLARALLIGFSTFFLAPLVAAILLVSTLGSVIGATLFFFYLCALMVSVALVGVVTGSYTLKLVQYSGVTPVISAILGVAVVMALMFVPIVGPLVVLTLWMITLGGVVEHVYRLVRNT